MVPSLRQPTAFVNGHEVPITHLWGRAALWSFNAGLLSCLPLAEGIGHSALSREVHQLAQPEKTSTASSE